MTTPDRLRDIPELRRDLSNIGEFAEAVREALQIFRGYRGDRLDRALTERRAIQLGLLNVNGTPGGLLITLPGGGGGGGGTTPDDPDLTPPPTPTGFVVSAGYTSLVVECDAPAYTQGHGHDRSVLYGAKWPASDPSAPVFSEAVKLTEFQGNVAAYPTDPGTRWCLWLKWKTRDGVESVTPAGGVNGVTAETGQDVDILLDVLTGKITMAQLFTDLSTPIGLLSLQQEDQASEDLRAVLGQHAEAKQRAQDLLAEAEDRGTALSTETTLRTEGDDQLSQMIVTLTAAVDSDRASTAAALQDEASARATADAAEATQRTTLAAQMRGTYTGTDVAALTEGLLYAERQARASADSAQVTRLDGLEATVNNPSTGVVATATALDAVEAVVNSGTQGNAALATRTSAIESTVNNPTTGVAATATALDTVKTLVNSSTQGNVALASRASTLEASVNFPTAGNNPTYAALQTEASVRAGTDNTLLAQYTVKVDLNGYVAGYGLAATSSGSTPSSDFAVRADRFYVAPPTTFTQEATPTATALGQVWRKPSTGELRTWDGSAWVAFTNAIPFVVNTTATTEGGTTVPPGVYIDGAFVRNLNAMVARIGTGTIDDAKIGSLSVPKLRGGSMTVGEYIQSANYTPGAAGNGWRINADGSAELQAAYIRGKLTTSQLQVGAASAQFEGSSFRNSYFLSSSAFSLDDTVIGAFTTTGAPVAIIGVVMVKLYTFSAVPFAQVKCDLLVDGAVVTATPIQFCPYINDGSGGYSAFAVVPIVVRRASLAAGSHSIAVRTVGYVYPFSAATASIDIYNQFIALENKV